MSRSRFTCFVPALLSILFVFAATLWSQRTTADVVGTVTDASGAVLPNVKVTIHNLDTNADFAAESDKSGEYAISQLPVGRYSMKAISPGLRPGPFRLSLWRLLTACARMCNCTWAIWSSLWRLPQRRRHCRRKVL